LYNVYKVELKDSISNKIIWKIELNDKLYFNFLSTVD